MPAPIPKDKVLEDIRRVAEKLGKEPSKADYNEHGEYSTYPAQTKFGSWTEAKEAAGVDVNRENEYVPKADVLDDLERVAEAVDGPVTKAAYEEHGQHHPSIVHKRCGSILEALDEIGLAHRVGKAPNGVDEERVKEDIRAVAEQVGHAPSRKEYGEHGKFSEMLPRIKFGSWSEAREEAGFENGPTKNEWVTKSELLADIESVAENIGRSPSQREYTENGEYTHTVVFERFGSFNAALEMLGLETRLDERTSREAFIQEIQRVGAKLDRVPSQADFREHGEYGLTPLKRRFGSWTDAVAKAGYKSLNVGAPPGERNPEYKEEPRYLNYTHEKWKENRPKALSRDGDTCQHPGCEMDRERHQEVFGVDLTMHHISREHWPDNKAKFHRLENLVTVCKRHHRVWEGTGLHPQEKA